MKKTKITVRDGQTDDRQTDRKKDRQTENAIYRGAKLLENVMA